MTSEAAVWYMYDSSSVFSAAPRWTQPRSSWPRRQHSTMEYIESFPPEMRATNFMLFSLSYSISPLFAAIDALFYLVDREIFVIECNKGK